MSAAAKATVTGLILAGGQARRMGGIDKGLVELQGRPMIAHTVERLSAQVDQLLINANRNLECYRTIAQCPVVRDDLGGFEGPLAGMAVGLKHAQTDFVLTVPCDSPLIASDLAKRLEDARTVRDSLLSVAHDGERLQPVFALLSTELLPSLREFLARGERKIDRWYAQHDYVTADFSGHQDTFLNINTPEDQRRLEQQLEGSS